MLRWIVKSLTTEPVRFLVSALGVAGAFTLVIFFEAVFEGESEKIVAYPAHAEADVWVMQRGVSNMHMATSMIWDWKRADVEALEGVQSSTPILYANSVMRAGGRSWFSYVVGLEADETGAGPWEVFSGAAMPGPGEALIPRVVAELSGIGLGDPIELLDRKLSVEGLTDGTFSMANSITFVAMQDLELMMDVSRAYSYLLVWARPGVDPAELASRIRNEVEGVNALTSAQFIRHDRDMALQMGVEVIWIMSLVSGLVAALIVGFAGYAQVVHLQRDFAVIKCIGFPGRNVMLAAVLQATVVTLAGFLGSVLLGFGLLPVISTLAPQVSILVLPAHYLPIALGALLVACAAALLPAWKIARVDPLTVFQG